MDSVGKASRLEIKVRVDIIIFSPKSTGQARQVENSDMQERFICFIIKENSIFFRKRQFLYLRFSAYLMRCLHIREGNLLY